MTKPPDDVLEKVSLEDVRSLFETHHQYAGVSNSSTYLWGLRDRGRWIAAFAWQPPAYGAAKSSCPEAPQAVLSLSRMVAVPKEERAHLSQSKGRHLSKLLRRQETMIDRTRYPVLITYSDEGLEHDGYTYQCAGWTPTVRQRTPQYVDDSGKRTSRYQNGKTSTAGLTLIGHAFIQRWENWACPRGGAAAWLEAHGWHRVPIPGKRWKSGSPAYRFERRPTELG
jgi:hypothetical protein